MTTHPYTRLFVLPAPPDADNDETEGYEIGDTVHVEGGSIYECRDASTGAAVWEEQAAGGATLAGVGAALNSAATDTVLDADTMHFWDAVDAVIKKITWANIKATLKTYFDTLYAISAHSHGTILTAENVYDIVMDSMSSGDGGGVDITFDDPGDDIFFVLNVPYVNNIIHNYIVAAGGWIPDSDTWTRTGNHTYTKSGDHTTTHRKSAKIRYRDGGADEFGVIGSSSYVGGGTNLTTINLIPNSDFAMAATTITDTYISYIENPEGFPHWFNWAWSPTNLSGGTQVAKWSAIAREILYEISALSPTIGGDVTFTPPVASVQSGVRPPVGEIVMLDFGTANYYGMTLQLNSTSFAVRVNNAAGTYTTNSPISGTVPFTWTTSDELNIKGRYPF